MNTRGLGFALVLMAMICSVSAAEGPGADRQYYELRIYTTQNEKQQGEINGYWEKAAIPAYRRAGAGPIGVFTEEKDSETNRVYVLIPYDSVGAFEGMAARLAADAAYQEAAGAFMNRSKNDAPYKRFDSSLLIAMKGMPKLALPPSSAEKKPWIFELRTYFSPTEAKGAKQKGRTRSTCSTRVRSRS
jgi:hypothetical protein